MSYLWRKCQVLMWKNVIVRKRHWFLTLFELVVPILLFWLIAYLRQNNFISPPTEFPEKVNERLTQAHLIDYGFVIHDAIDFAYAPQNSFTNKIIQEFNKTLVSVLLNSSKLESFNAFDSELQIEEFFLGKYGNKSAYTNHEGFGIVFENVANDNAVMKDFKYKIRSTIPKWDTEGLFPQLLPTGPIDEGDIYIHKGFLAIQMAIDSAFIKVAGGGSSLSTYEMSVQKFPFPSFRQDFFNDLFKSLIPVITMLSFITISIAVLKKVVEEKASGVNELMKMMGLQTWMLWGGWVFNGLMVYAITCGVITFLLCYAFDPTKGSVIAHVHFTIVFALYLLFCIASIFFCFAISAFFMRPTLAVSAGMTLWILSFSALQRYVVDATVPFAVQLLLCLIPLYNILTGYVVIAAFESREVTITWLNLFSDATGGNGMSLGITLIMFFMQMVVYMFITWYVTSIHPGPYGRAEPWYFILKFLKSTKKTRDPILNEFDDEEEEQFEIPPKNLKVGLKIQDLRKIFDGKVVAVDKVNLDICEGEITALLGHNGAGKTTTMSIITGMYSPTSGTVYANNYNIFENMDLFRSSLGLCPQHDLLFPYLTPIEHLIFFGMLKGMKMNLARSEGLKLLQMLHISEKKNVLAEKLSGGMKRKLSLAIALIGSPKVLVLDEPTSGMDPESRREMWNLLLKLREGRTILITTHFMEEADVLGDRIAIMDHGRVKCYGSTLFLKRIYGTGYQLTVMKEPESPVEPITYAIKSKVADADLKTTHSSQVTYKVPQEHAPKLSAMFAFIETNKAKLGITGVGISCTTMEEVFLRVGQLAREEKYEFDKTSAHSRDHNTLRNMSNEALTLKKLKGIALWIQQFKSLVPKRALFTIRRPILSVIYFVIPLLMTWMTIKSGLADILQGQNDPPLTMKLSMYGQTQSYVSGSSQYQDVFKQLVSEQGSLTTTVQQDMIKTLLQAGKDNLARYKTRVIIAADFNNSLNSATGLFNGIAYHAAPISLNMISNSLLKSNPTTAVHSITTTNHPLDIENFAGACSQLHEASLWLGTILWVIMIPIGMRCFMMDLITFPHLERTSNAKQLQLMTGVSPPTYWLACFTWDYLMYLALSTLMFIVILLFDTTSLFSEARDYGVFSMILVLHGVSGICYIYLYSFLGKSANTASSIYVFISLLTGVIGPFLMRLLVTLANNGVLQSSLIKPLFYLLCLEPQFALGSAILDFSYLLMLHSACKHCNNESLKQQMCLDTPYLEFSSNKVENQNHLLLFILFLAFDWLVYMGVIMLIEYGYMGRAIHWLKAKWVGKDFDKLLDEDTDVRHERDLVDSSRSRADVKMTPMSKSTEGDMIEEESSCKRHTGDDKVVLTVDGLAKKFSRSFAAVQGVSFRVSAGECFGLLGVNGAGKTTTFRMLTGDETPTAGSARLMNFDLTKNKAEYLAQVGYCPQFDGINEFLTGEEVMQLFANLRGIPQNYIQPQIEEWINLLGLEEYRHRRCGTYSGGNKRKLSTAMALIGDPAVVFLDEPTTGVDPVARRNLWDVLGRCQKSGQAIVLTSHSMEECEALCTRLTIMVRGRMKCIGNNQYLKQRYGQGYTIMIKIFPHLTQDNLVSQLKQEVQSAFPSKITLKDEHTTLLHYHMSDPSMALSKLFEMMDNLKKSYASVIEDYTVSDTTLEQVFIAFARQAGES